MLIFRNKIPCFLFLYLIVFEKEQDDLHDQHEDTYRLYICSYQNWCYFHLIKDTFNKLGYKAKINTHTTSYIN